MGVEQHYRKRSRASLNVTFQYDADNVIQAQAYHRHSLVNEFGIYLTDLSWAK